MEDGGLRVPLILSGPGRVPAATRVDRPTTTPDLYATLLGQAGLPVPSEQCVDGIDIWPTLRDAGGDSRPIFWHYPHYSNQGGTPGAAIREGRWKLIRWFTDGREALYDLEADPGEAHDRATAEPGVRTRLAGHLDAWSRDVGARVPEPNPHAGRGPWS